MITPADPTPPRTTTGRAALPWLVAIFAVALTPLLTTPVLPFIDLYDHLARYFVLAHVDDSPRLARDYAANWALLPNIGLDIFGTALLRVLPPRFAAHAIVAVVFAVQYGGVLAFNRVLSGRWSVLVALLLVPLLYSFILNWGFANFLCGLGLVFWGAAWWLAKRSQPLVAVPVACVIAVVIFFCHGLTFALYGILVALLEVGIWWTGRDRRIARLAVALIPVLVQAVVPVALFLLGRVVKTGGGLTNADAAIARLSASGRLSSRIVELLAHRLTTIVRVAEGPSLGFDIIAFGVVLAIVALLLRRRTLTVPRLVWPALAGLALLVAVTPPAMFAVGYVADRMPLFFALLLVGSLAVTPGATGLRTAIMVLAALVVVRLVAIAADWQTYRGLSDEFATVAERIPPGSLIVQLIVGGSPRDGAGLRYDMYGPLTISLHGQIGALFANEAEQPLRLVGALKRAVDALPPGSSAGNMPMAYYDRRLAAFGPAGFDYVLVNHAAWLTRPLPPTAQVVARTPHFLLLRLSPGDR